jgi:hypothetical protein
MNKFNGDHNERCQSIYLNLLNSLDGKYEAKKSEYIISEFFIETKRCDDVHDMSFFRNTTESYMKRFFFNNYRYNLDSKCYYSNLHEFSPQEENVSIRIIYHYRIFYVKALKDALDFQSKIKYYLSYDWVGHKTWPVIITGVGVCSRLLFSVYKHVAKK